MESEDMSQNITMEFHDDVANDDFRALDDLRYCMGDFGANFSTTLVYLLGGGNKSKIVYMKFLYQPSRLWLSVNSGQNSFPLLGRTKKVIYFVLFFLAIASFIILSLKNLIR